MTVRRASLSQPKFLSVYTPAARDGESLAQIAKRLTEKFKENYDSVDVSQKASVARNYLRKKEAELKKMFGENFDIEKYIADNVPNVGGQGGGGGRKSGLSGLTSLFATLTPPKDEEAEPTAEGAESEEVAEATETEAAE